MMMMMMMMRLMMMMMMMMMIMIMTDSVGGNWNVCYVQQNFPRSFLLTMIVTSCGSRAYIKMHP